MPKVYIAGPMTGLPGYNYPAFNDAERDLRAAGLDTLNPVLGEAAPTPADAKPWGWYLRRALRMVLDADGVATLPGWKKSRGAVLEVHVARALGVPVMPVATWLQVANLASPTP